MTMQEKKAWLENATDKQLLDQVVSLIMSDKYGCNQEDIRLTKEEILKRMSAYGK